MSWVDLLWLPPIMLAVSIVLGAAGRNGFKVIARSILQTFVALTLGVIAVGISIHLLSTLFA